MSRGSRRRQPGIDNDSGHQLLSQDRDPLLLVLQESLRQFRRTSSVREPVRRGTGRIASILEAFGSRRKSSRPRDIPEGATIHDVDPHAFSSRDSKQQRIDTMLKKDKKKDMWRAISSWFHFSHIPAHAADNPYYRSAISSIQAAGAGVDPPGSRDIYEQLLDSNKKLE